MWSRVSVFRNINLITASTLKVEFSKRADYCDPCPASKFIKQKLKGLSEI